MKINIELYWRLKFWVEDQITQPIKDWLDYRRGIHPEWCCSHYLSTQNFCCCDLKKKS